MKSLLLGTAILFSSASYANEAVLDDVAKLPKIFNQSLVVNHGPQFAAVQPTAHLKFDYPSCRRFNFSVEVIDGGEVNFLKVHYPRSQADCRAMPIKRTYELQVSSDYDLGAKSFVILNPVGQDLPIFRVER